MLYKKPRQQVTGEYKFLNKFLESGYFDKYNDRGSNFTLIHEPFTELGYADLVCVRWKRPVGCDWKDYRNRLIKDDIRILHHLYNCQIFKSAREIVGELGFSEKEVDGSLLRLHEAGLITENVRKDKVKIKSIKKIFFICEIIAIEAKLQDWKGALQQSLNNILFASKAFALLPDKIISKKMLEHYQGSNVGVLSFNTTFREVVQPKTNKIPTNITSWYFNEYIGRSYFS